MSTATSTPVPSSRRRSPHGLRPGTVLCTLAGLGQLLVLLPLAGLLVRAPWSTLVTLAREPVVSDALVLSVTTSLIALALSVALGVPLAWVFARLEFPGKQLARALAVMPMVLPPVVGGVALLVAFGRNGLVGAPLASLTGVTLPFSTAGVVLAQTFVAMPFLVVSVEAGLRQADLRLEAAAATLGARRWTVFRRVTIPLVAPALGAGAALCWARALGEFGATITFAGNLQGRTQTMPLAVALLLETDSDAAVLLSLVLLALSVGVLVGLRGRFLGVG